MIDETLRGDTRAHTASLRRVYLTSAICCALVGLYGLAHLSPAPVVELICSCATVVAAVLWLQADARAHRIQTVHDWGYFAFVAWPVIVPWYAFKTRGQRGWSIATRIYLAILAPPVLSSIIKVMEHLR